MRSRSRGALLVIVTVLAVPAASAHVPVVGGQSREIDASRSWAFYEELGPGQVDAWSFRAAQGDRLFLQVAVPTGQAQVPVVTLEGPAGAVALAREDLVELEPFTPYASRVVWTFDGPAPASGDYALSVTGGPAHYVLGFGEREVFSVGEWLTVPIVALRVHVWAGASWALLALPYAAGLLAAALAWRDSRAARRPMLFAALAAGLVIGTTLERLVQISLALAAGARPSVGTLAFAVGLAVPSALVALVLWRARRAWAILAAGLAALATWSGLIVGGALALAAGIAIAARGARRASAARGKPQP